MSLPTTEMPHTQAAGLDVRPLEEAGQILAEGQIAAARAVLPAISDICDGARAMAQAIRDGGRLVYVGAGSSGLMAAADAMELGGTFGIPSSRVQIVMAGGLPTSSAMPGDTEDEIAGLEADLADLSPRDTVIAVAASGTTPFTVAAVQIAKAKGATVIGLANNAGTPLLDTADIAVLLATPPEVISGSTRTGAGTAQKIALNTMSTLMGVQLGHVYDGLMVNVVADNEKLRQRAAGIVRAISGTDARVAAEALSAAQGGVKAAVLLASGAASLAAAEEALEKNNGNLRGALERLRET